MNRTFFLILISVFVFIGINTVFYFTIYNQQLAFQTELLSQQTGLCGNTIEQEGQQFENELNSIPFQDDFTRLFIDEEIKQRGSINLQKLYTGYHDLINKITVYDNNNNVYSLILDQDENFVSDYYESQRQFPLKTRDELSADRGKYTFSIPGFDDTGEVQSNILVDLNYTRFVIDIFDRYSLENILWHTLISPEGELITVDQKINIPESDLKHIGSQIFEEAEGSYIHTVTIDSVPTRVVSSYYPVRLINRDFGIIFSIKTDIFLHSIIIKIIIISLCSLILLTLVLYIHFRVVKVKTEQDKKRKFSEDSLRKTIDILPLGLLFINPDGTIRLINQPAAQILGLELDSRKVSYTDLGLEDAPVAIDDSIYQRTFGPGSLLIIRNESSLVHIYKLEWEQELGGINTRVIMMVDVSLIESARNLDKAVLLSRSDLLDSMGQEIAVPLNKLQDAISDLEKSKSGKQTTASVENLKKSFSLLTNLIKATMDFAVREAGQAVTEEIPFFLRSEIEIALDHFRGDHSNISVITKIRNDVPDKLVGDPFRLRQVLYNLVDNAMEQTSEGRILISAEVVEHHAGILKLQFYVEDTGKGMSEEKTREIMNELDLGDTSLHEDTDSFRRRLFTARHHLELMKGQLWLTSPSTISTSPDLPGIKCTFSMEVFSGESLKDNLIFKDISRLEDIECLVLSQEKETESERFFSFQEQGLNFKYLVYRKENIESLIKLVVDKAASLHMLVIIHSASENGFQVSEELIRKGITDNLVVILLSSVHTQENYSLSRNIGIEYYLEEPFPPYQFADILSIHFPGLNMEVLNKVPKPEEIDQGISVLLAEDNLFNRKVIQGLFKRLGFEIDEAENGLEALQMVKEKDYDIIFMDLVMPEMDGLQAAAEIRKGGSKVPIVALTAVENNESRIAANEAGFNDYLIKPASEESLRKVILQSLSKSR